MLLYIPLIILAIWMYCDDARVRADIKAGKKK